MFPGQGARGGKGVLLGKRDPTWVRWAGGHLQVYQQEQQVETWGGLYHNCGWWVEGTAALGTLTVEEQGRHHSESLFRWMQAAGMWLEEELCPLERGQGCNDITQVASVTKTRYHLPETFIL